MPHFHQHQHSHWCMHVTSRSTRDIAAPVGVVTTPNLSQRMPGVSVSTRENTLRHTVPQFYPRHLTASYDVPLLQTPYALQQSPVTRVYGPPATVVPPDIPMTFPSLRESSMSLSSSSMSELSPALVPNTVAVPVGQVESASPSLEGRVSDSQHSSSHHSSDGDVLKRLKAISIPTFQGIKRAYPS